MKKLSKDLKEKLEKLITEAAELQDELNDARQATDDYLSERSDKWKEDHESDYEDFQGEIDQIIDALTAVAELSAEVQYNG